MRVFTILISLLCGVSLCSDVWAQESEMLFDTRQYGSGTIYSFDTGNLNGDGVPDFLLGTVGVEGCARFVMSDGSGGFRDLEVCDFPGFIQNAQYARFDPDGPLGIVNLVSPSSSSRVFQVFANSSDAEQIRFSMVSSEEIPNLPQEFAVGDLNNDGRDDVVFMNRSENSVSILLGKGGGVFLEPTTIPVPLNHHEITIFDINGDGALDMVVAYDFAGDMGVLLGVGDGTFEDSYTLEFLQGFRSFGLGDLNSDGFPDIVLGYNFEIKVYLGLGDDQFQFLRSHAIGEAAQTILIKDINGDANPDVIVANVLSDTISVLYGNFNGSLDFHKQFQTPHQPKYLAASDFNLDGVMDIAVGGARGVLILQGNGPKGFRTGTTPFGRFHDTEQFAVNDVNADGFDDLIVPYGGGSNSLGVYLATGDGGFESPVDSMPTNNQSMITMGDFNTDGVDDIVMADQFSFKIAFLPGAGDGAFGDVVESEGPTRGIASIFAVDMDTDGNLDVVLATGRRVYVLLGDGEGVFTLGETIRHPISGDALLMEDFDGDGIQDFARAYIDKDDAQNNYYKMDVFLGNGTGGVGESIVHQLDARAGPMCTGDVNLDGIPDVLISVFTEPLLKLLYGVGDGTFVDGAELEIGSFVGSGGGISSILVGDIDYDRVNDILVTLPTTHAIGVYRGDRSSDEGEFDTGFGEIESYGVAPFPLYIGLGDLDGDGDSDVVTLNRSSSGLYNIGTLINRTDPCLADLNGDGALDFFDISLLLSQQWDWNGDGIFDLLDIYTFLEAYIAGCP